MTKLPGGRFAMGSHEDRTELPVHEVTIAAFAIGKYPVTLGQWRQCVAAKACKPGPDGDDDLPVYGMSWNDAQDFVKWLSAATGAHYRLPSEAEWEYAARGGTHSKYWWGERLVPGKTACKGCGTNYQASRPMKIGSFSPNPFGIYDIDGTVAQWVSDCWHKNYEGAPRNGKSWDARDCDQHVLRGGAWNNDVSYLRTSSRDFYDTSVRYPSHGFRVARSLSH